MCRSRIAEEYTEKEQLLQEIEDLQRKYKSSRKNNNSSLQKLGTQARDTALKNVYTSEATGELEIQELTSPISLYPNVSPMFSPLPILSSTPVSLQQDSISSAYSTDTVVRNPSPAFTTTIFFIRTRIRISTIIRAIINIIFNNTIITFTSGSYKK